MRNSVQFAALLACTVVTLAGCGESRQAAADREKIQALQLRLQRLQADVRHARDVSAIKKLQRSYGYYLDRGRADDLTDLFSDNEPVAGYEAGAFVGKENIRKALRFLGPDNTLPEGRMMTHMQLQGVVSVAEDGQTANGRWRALAITSNAGQARWQEGPYEMQYVKEDGVWKIKDLHWHQTFVAPYEGGWPKHSSARPTPIAAAGETRPVPDRPWRAKTWPDAMIPPYHYKNPVTGK